MAKISLILKKQNYFKNSMLITSSVLFVFMVVSVYWINALNKEYKHQLNEFEKLNQSYDEYLRIQNAAMKQPEDKSLNLDVFDRIMTARPQNLFFDRMKLSKNSTLQIEGITLKPLEIDEFIHEAALQGVKLQINQVQKDNDQQVHFDIRQVS
ncbi:hypothetical protein Q5X45_16925 [Acinetobacter baumannii]|nr:hypothetical protein [Acinetobacter baumannii]